MERLPTVAAPAALPPAVLAYMGDAVFELYVRRALIDSGRYANVQALHRRAIALVCAPAQARMARAMAAELTPEESAVLRRGRNVHSGRVPQGVDVAAYRLATGFEALAGFLFLSGRLERLQSLLAGAIKEMGEG